MMHRVRSAGMLGLAQGPCDLRPDGQPRRGNRRNERGRFTTDIVHEEPLDND